MSATDDRDDAAPLALEPRPTDPDPPARSEPPAPRRGRSLVTPSLLDFLR